MQLEFAGGVGKPDRVTQSLDAASAVCGARRNVDAFFPVMSIVLRQPMVIAVDFTGAMSLGGSATRVMNGGHDGLAVVAMRQIMGFGWRLEIVEVIADFVARKNLGRHQLRSNVPLGIAQEKTISGVYIRPDIGRRGNRQT